jgi:hypothetical protein
MQLEERLPPQCEPFFYCCIVHRCALFKLRASQRKQ